MIVYASSGNPGFNHCEGALCLPQGSTTSLRTRWAAAAILCLQIISNLCEKNLQARPADAEADAAVADMRAVVVTIGDPAVVGIADPAAAALCP